MKSCARKWNAGVIAGWPAGVPRQRYREGGEYTAFLVFGDAEVGKTNRLALP